MRSVHVVTLFCAVLMGAAAAPSGRIPHPADATSPTPLILEKDEGEKRTVRGWPGHPDPGETLNLKVDRKNGGSSHLVFFTADLPPGNSIDTHRHAHADEILYLESGTARVQLGDLVKEVHGGSTVFIPSGTWISVSNIGKENIGLVCIFSAPGFEEWIRDTSVREGEKKVPISQAEEDALEKKYSHVVLFK